MNEKISKSTPGLAIIVSTGINDGDSIFNAIRIVPNLVGMLQAIQEDKPPLSPSIALQLLTHFRAKPSNESSASRKR